MTFEFTSRRRVEFCETDLAGIVHFSNFFRYMEAAEHEFFRSLGLTAHGGDDPSMLGFARVHASCDYHRPLHYPEEFEIRVLVMEIGAKSIRYQFRFTVREQEIARGEISVACVQRENGDRMRAVDLPSAVTEKLTTAPAEMLAE